MKKTVLTYGTFDLFHTGHVRLLKRLASLGDKLIVGVSSDEFNNLKGKQSFFSYEERAEIVMACRYVDAVFPENNWEQKIADIQKYNATIFAMGSDWEGKFDDLRKYCQVIYLPRTNNISTTEIKTKLSRVNHKEKDNVYNKVKNITSITKVISQ